VAINFDMSQLLDILDDLDKKVKKDISKNALNAGADVILEGQQANVPVDSGDLKESLDKGKVKGGANAKINIGIEKGDKDTLRYGYYQEYGTESMIGKKWMKSAWNDSKDQALEKIKESIINDLIE
jgi:HK97 gp10 family phage protein